jgi:hypothetical protein
MITKTISSIGYMIGMFTIFIFTWKFFIYSNFTSMWLVGCGVGFIIFAFAYLYSWMKMVEGRLEGIMKIYTKEEWADD